jgi:dipeptidyl aminopeptidase/acylaminoacyl peptidase
MRSLFTAALFICTCLAASAQPPVKKTIDHSVYDRWQTTSERMISNDGRFVVYAVNPQEGDGQLVIQSADGTIKKVIDRGYNATITFDSRFIIFRIKPFFKDTRDAKIKKKKPDEMPKDTLAIAEWGVDTLVKTARVKSYKTPEKAAGWLAYQMDKALPETPGKPKTGVLPDSLTQIANVVRMADSLKRMADSLLAKTKEAQKMGLSVLTPPKKESKPAAKPADDPIEEGTDLVLRNLLTGKEEKFKLVSEYYFNRNGQRLLIETTRKNSDTLSRAAVLWRTLAAAKTDTVLKAFNDAKSYAMDEDGTQLAFVAERDSVAKALRKYYKLWYYKTGMDSAQVKAHKDHSNVAKGLTVSADYNNTFSKNGEQLFFGLAPIRKPKDTTLVDFETARLDVWNYNDDYLQTVQLNNLAAELRRSYAAVYNTSKEQFVQVGGPDAETVVPINEGNANYVLSISTKGNRIESQWTGDTKQTAYIISTSDGSRKLVGQNQPVNYSISPGGKYVWWYDDEKRQYFTYNVATGKTANVTKDIKVPLWDEEDDHPAAPPPHGTMRWHEGDRYVYVYDRYDVWRVQPDGTEAPARLTNGAGRKYNVRFRYQAVDREERFIENGQRLHFTLFNYATKHSGLAILENSDMITQFTGAFSFNALQKAQNADRYIYTRERADEPINLYSIALSNASAAGDTMAYANVNPTGEVKLSSINVQQKEYNWLTCELVKWKMLDGKMSEGLIYKPENFDPAKKYPVIFYFYERDADNLYGYRGPAPTASTINIPWFVSNGYIVMDPNIYYKNGEPGQSAYNSVISAARYMAKMPWVDSTKMAIQGQSWGGYQVAYLVTRTKMFAAAGAGAPVANMTSAYGGIRWGSGVTRQFQYEKGQSRIGASLWQQRDLYIKNSPLFFADKVTTPLLIMHNDKDGAVPWWQGIEYFTALRRMGKKVWMLQYNDEDHNLVERRNRKDLSVRLGQFFDYYLKGGPLPKWMKEGVPATEKGVEWGLDY